ncbi:MAG: RNA-directed DNA polymerase [Candidatus Electryoneaceae bacterium]|nr:RNA-directed DNA polymerase [Candidatus Electryoneaceae bacterium]
MALQIYDLLANGYFPKELPPPFTTVDYASALAGKGATIPSGAFISSPKYSMTCNHNLVKTGGLRRNLGIPNPKHFFRLAEHIVKHWAKLKACADGSPYSLTKPVAGEPGRAIMPEHNLNKRTEHRVKFRSTARYVLLADISLFFPSIYTHSIPWGIMGKTIAKNARISGALEGRWEDKLDMFSRSINNNQTVGIPIGPDTSRLLAEVLLSRIDVELQTKDRKIKGFRYIDDYEFATATRSDAEKILSDIQHLLSQFELALNTTKTKIVELPYKFDPYWTSRIRVFMFRDGGPKELKRVQDQKYDLIAYFDMVFDLLKRFPEEGLMKYAIGRFKSVEVKPDNWSLFENILSQCVLIEPACLPQVCDQITHYKTLRYRINKGLWSNCLNRIVYERVPLGHSSEAAWAMWLMKLLKIRLLRKSALAVGRCEDSVTALMGLGLVASGLTSPRYLSELHRFSDASGLYEEQWLLCYQGNMMEWLGSRSNRSVLRRDPAISHLESNSVSFFDIGIAPPKAVRFPSSTGYYHSDGGY